MQLTCGQRDSASQHVTQANEAIRLGSMNREGGNPYLDIGLLTQVALDANADAVHPGYGYLSENAKFVDAITAAGITFIGPASNAMSTLGDKRSAKAYLREHDPKVPLIPGVSSSSQNPEELERMASEIGYPVMLKASAGGGGKGMRIVHDPSAFRAELKLAQSEASRFFGSSDCILEKFIEAGKHIEIQIMGDRHGNVVSLNERECSIQRRHQKVVEETPSIWLNPRQRADMSEAACRVGKLLAYENAGTVEFVFDVATGKFYFLEVNTRLQVEHPITEETTRLDVVSLQIFVAAGGNLSTLPQLDSVPQVGHAIECRLCAEDPTRDFYPENGTIRLWKLSNDTKHTRVETAVATGSNVSIHFDSMIAKFVVWAPTRTLARAKMIRLLADTAIIGVRTNQKFLQSCLMNDGFSDPAYTTSFIPQRLKSLLSPARTQAEINLQRALPLVVSHALDVLPRYLTHFSTTRAFSNIRPKFRNQAFDTVNSGERRTIVTSHDAATSSQVASFCAWEPNRSAAGPVRGYAASLPQSAAQKSATAATSNYNALTSAIRAGNMPDRADYTLDVLSCEADHSSTASASGSWITGTMSIAVNGMVSKMYLATETSDLRATRMPDTGQGFRIMVHLPLLGTWFSFNVFSTLSYFEHLREAVGGDSQAKLKVIPAPMPCKVVSVLKKNGEKVKAGEIVMVVESMKMEINISAAVEGTFSSKVQEQDAVDEGSPLCAVE